MSSSSGAQLLKSAVLHQNLSPDTGRKEIIMAKATATCTCATCGAEFTVTAYKYNRREADSWESWAESHYDECDECREKRIQSERDEANRKAAENAASAGLPALTGSQKQIAWATTIRDGILAICSETIADLQLVVESGEASDEYRDDLLVDKLIRSWLLTKTEAAWWIDNRGKNVDGGLDMILIIHENEIQSYIDEHKHDAE